MTLTPRDYVVFEFADRVLEGRIVDVRTTAAFNQPPERVFTVARDGCQYSVPEGNLV